MPHPTLSHWRRSFASRVHAGSVPESLLIVAALVVASAIAAVDWVTGPATSMVIFYALLVMAVTWLGRVSLGIGAAVLSTAIGATLAVLDPGDTNGGVWLWNTIVPCAFYLLVVWLVAGQRALLNSQEERATIDPLTGILTRRAFYERVEIELERARRERRPIAFVYLDGDGLKDVNDTIGHAAGDEVLRDFVEMTNGAKRGADLFGRLGGDEFALLLVGTDVHEATAVAERVLERLRQAPGGRTSASIGVVACPHAPRQLEGTVRLADQLMYLAKRAGGSVVRSTEFDPNPDIDLRATAETRRASGESSGSSA